jgi:2-dehydro-3-deoxygalactonokinase
LFEVRSRQLIDGWGPAFAMDFLSGLLIGADVGGAMAEFGGAGEVVLVGDPALAGRYGQALARRGVAARTLSGEDCALAGLAAIFETGKDAPHVAR